MPEWTSVGLAVTAYKQRVGTGTSDESAPPDVLRAELARGLASALASEGLRTAFGPPPGAIGAVPPFGVVLWESGLVPTTLYNPSGTGEVYDDWGGGDQQEEGTLLLAIIVGALGPDLVTLQSAAEQWKIPLHFFVSQHPSLAGLVETATWRGFDMGTWQWGDTTYYCGFGHVRVTTVTRPPVPLA